MENLEQNKDAAELASEAAFEMVVANEARDFLRNLPEDKRKKSSFRPIYIASIAASLLVIIASVVTINLSHNKHSIAAKYGINALVARSANNVQNSQFTDAVQAYYAEDYEKSKSLLAEMGQDGGKVTEYQDWLTLLIELQTSGSKSETFNNKLGTIIESENHEFNLQAMRLRKDLDHFWRKFVVNK